MPAAGRLELLDFLRGMGMMLVLFQHSDIPYGDWILIFHMPFLFLLSGYTMFLWERPWKFWEYLKNRILRLVVPYFLFEGLNLFVWSASLILQGGWQDLSEAIVAIVTCVNTQAYTGYYGRLWFLPCMFVSDMLFYGIRKLCRGKQLGMWLCAGLMLAISWYTSNRLQSRLPFASDTAFFAVFFLLLGYLLGKQISWLTEKKHVAWDAAILLGLLLIMRKCVLSGKAFCWMYVNRYGEYGYTLGAAISGTLAFFIIVKWFYALVNKIGVGKNLILWYGYHSLGTFPIHLSIKIWMMNHIPWDYRPWYVVFVAMLIVNIPIVNFITKYMPFMLGKFPRRRKAVT